MLCDNPLGGVGKLERPTRLGSNLGGGDEAGADLAEDWKPDGSGGRACLGTSGLGENLCCDDFLDLTLCLASVEAAREGESISILISRGL